MARAAWRGIWAETVYRVRGNRDNWRLDVGSFQLIEGRIGRISERDGRSGLLAVAAGKDGRTFRRGGFDPVSLEGRAVRLRGVVQSVGGRPQITLANRAQIEILP